MSEQSPLRRWKPFFSAFDLVDAAIEAADLELRRCRDEFRSTRGAVVERLCGVPAGAAAGEAEKLCLVLDEFMAESLVTLRTVPACAVRRVLESSADLTKAVCALRWCHQSERVRGLAGDVIHGWSVAVENDISKDAAELDAACRVEAAAEASRRRPLPNAKRDGPEEEEEEKMAATKRKLREGYREVENAKHQRKIQVIEAPEMLELMQRKKIHPILREQSKARIWKRLAPNGKVPLCRRPQRTTDLHRCALCFVA